MSGLRSKIRSLFARFGDSGDFGEVDSRAPFLIVAPGTTPGRLIFATKSHLVPKTIPTFREATSPGTICRYGLPAENDLPWMRAVASQHRLYFLGDLDPVDLLVFVWLRDGLSPQPIEYLGVSDSYLEALAAEIPLSHQIFMSPDELEARKHLPELLPNLKEFIGARALQIIKEGRKVELEAVLAALGGHEHLLRPLESHEP